MLGHHHYILYWSIFLMVQALAFWIVKGEPEKLKLTDKLIFYIATFFLISALILLLIGPMLITDAIAKHNLRVRAWRRRALPVLWGLHDWYNERIP